MVVAFMCVCWPYLCFLSAALFLRSTGPWLGSIVSGAYTLIALIITFPLAYAASRYWSGIGEDFRNSLQTG